MNVTGFTKICALILYIQVEYIYNHYYFLATLNIKKKDPVIFIFIQFYIQLWLRVCTCTYLISITNSFIFPSMKKETIQFQETNQIMEREN